MDTLTKMRAQDLLTALLTYCMADDTDEQEREHWHAWNRAWERADDSLRRDALMMAGTHLAQARKELARASSTTEENNDST